MIGGVHTYTHTFVILLFLVLSSKLMVFRFMLVGYYLMFLWVLIHYVFGVLF